MTESTEKPLGLLVGFQPLPSLKKKKNKKKDTRFMTVLNKGICYAFNPLDRTEKHRRAQENTSNNTGKNNKKRFLLFKDSRIITDDTAIPLRLDDTGLPDPKDREAVFLGMEHNVALWAVAADASQTDDSFLLALCDATGLQRGKVHLTDGRALAAALGPDHGDTGLFAQAKSLLSWHQTHQFCAKCGKKTFLAAAGYQRICKTCNAVHFPRTDPVVIMLPIFEDRILLGRGPGLPAGIFSALAGFIEPGETLEAAVCRELSEEADMKIDKISYWGSQPWPWPSSLMLGCFARATSPQVIPDGDEIDDLRWITRQDFRLIRAREHPTIHIPPESAIARNLMDYWYDHPLAFADWHQK